MWGMIRDIEQEITKKKMSRNSWYVKAFDMLKKTLGNICHFMSQNFAGEGYKKEAHENYSDFQ